MGPDDECVIHIVKPANGLVGQLLQGLFFKVHYEEVDMTGDSWIYNYTVIVLVELAIEAKKGVVKTWRKILRMS